MSTSINALVIKEIEHKIIECGIHRILACVEKLTEAQLTYRPNSNSNSINNQILHLNGNVRQWLISSFSDVKDARMRDEEFDSTNVKSKSELTAILTQLEKDVRTLMPLLMEIDLTEEKDVQCYREPSIGIIIHVIEHFSYHVGQITYITKMILDIDTGYYADLDLNRVN